MNNIDKLPKWAQDHIHTVQRERDLAVKALRDFEGKQAKTKVWIEDRLRLGESRGPASVTQYLDTHEVTFQVGLTEGDTVDVGWDLHGQFTVRSSFRSLVILPMVSNQIEVRLEDK